MKPFSTWTHVEQRKLILTLVVCLFTTTGGSKAQIAYERNFPRRLALRPRWLNGNYSYGDANGAWEALQTLIAANQSLQLTAFEQLNVLIKLKF